jgi:hypothetical protein
MNLMSQNKIIGVDSGKSGCICELDFTEMRCRWLKMPWTTYDEIDVHKILKSFDLKNSVVYLEEVKGDPKFGCKNFAFGANFGQILIILRSVSKRLEKVHPKGWQGYFYKQTKGDKAKELSLRMFLKMNPTTFMADEYVAARHEGLMDAFLVAMYGAIREKKVDELKSFNFHFEKL